MTQSLQCLLRQSKAMLLLESSRHCKDACRAVGMYVVACMILLQASDPVKTGHLPSTLSMWTVRRLAHALMFTQDSYLPPSMCKWVT